MKVIIAEMFMVFIHFYCTGTNNNNKTNKWLDRVWNLKV